MLRRRRRRLEEAPIETPGEEEGAAEPLCGQLGQLPGAGALARAARALLRGVHRERGAWSPTRGGADHEDAAEAPRRSARRRGRERGCRGASQGRTVFHWRRRDRPLAPRTSTLRHPDWGAIEVRVDGDLAHLGPPGHSSAQQQRHKQPSAISLEWRRWRRQASKTLGRGPGRGLHDHSRDHLRHLNRHHEQLYGAALAGLHYSLKVQNCR